MSTNERKAPAADVLEIMRRDPTSVTVVFRLTPDEKAQLHRFAREHDCTTSDVLYTALALIRAIRPAAANGGGGRFRTGNPISRHRYEPDSKMSDGSPPGVLPEMTAKG